MNFIKQLRFSIKKVVELIKIHSRYSFKKPIKECPKCFVQLIDGTIYHGGLADRFNSIITAYALSKAVGSDYRLLHSYPFDISDHLNPNLHNWSPSGVSYNHHQIEVVRLKTKLRKPIKIDHNKQQHAYFHCDSLDSINSIYGSQYTYGELFNELFKPSLSLQEKIDFHRSQLPLVYDSIVFRFQNLLGDFHEGPFKPYSKERQEELIDICLNYLKANNKEKILVTSDSTSFIKRASKIDNVYTIEGDMVHMQYRGGSHDINEKPFLDFYMLSLSRRINLFMTMDMYNSGFPRVAAKINEIPFRIISQ